MARAFIARALGGGPRQEAKPKSGSGKMTMSPASKIRPLELVRAKLAEAEIPEARLIRWLKDRGAISAGTRGLQCVSPRRIEILLEQWEDVLDQL
jgi:hypothetical protein